jgi:multiple sugar transport system permease protein
MMRNLFRARNPFDPSPGWMGFSYIILGIWTFIVLFPLYWLLITAFKTPADVNNGPRYLPFIDFQPSLQAWQFLLADPTSGNMVSRPYINTIGVGLLSSLFALLLGAGAAYALTRFQYRPQPAAIATFALCIGLAILLIAIGIAWPLAVIIGLAVFILLLQTIGRRFKGTMSNNDIGFWLISQRMLPPITTIVPIYIVFQQLRMLDTWGALIISYVAAHLPLVVWFLRDYFQNIPIELEESAFIDGASRYQMIWRIVLPLAVPGLIATFLIILVFAWNEYTLALFLTNANAQTMPLLVASQNATRGPQWWNISVLVVLMIAPIIVAAIALERFIARGLLVGALKG